MSNIKELVQNYVQATLNAYIDYNLPPADAHIDLYTAIDKLEEDTKLLEAHLESCQVLQEMNGEKIERLEAENAELKAKLAALKAQEPVCFRFRADEGDWFVTAKLDTAHKYIDRAASNWEIEALYIYPKPEGLKNERHL